MTIISGSADGSTNILTQLELQGLSDGDIVSASSTSLVVNTDPGPVVTFTGSGVSYSNEAPVSGTVTGISLLNQGSSSPMSWTGFSVSAPTLWADVKAANATAIEELLFGGDDTFTSHTVFNTAANGAHANVFEGFDGNDTFNMQSSEGDDTVRGDSGNDAINFGADFTAKDLVDGGSGTDTLTLDGNYASGVTFGSRTMVGVEKVLLSAGHGYKLVTNDATVAHGATLTVDGSKLGAHDSLTFNGAAEKDGRFVLTGGAGNDTLTGGAGKDTLKGGAGSDVLKGGGAADHLSGGAGADHFVYGSASDSTGSKYDTITGFNTLNDAIDVAGKITGINHALTSGKLSTGSFNTELAKAVNSDTLAAHHAVEFTASAGTLKGDHFLIVDLNGHAGYQAGSDLVIALDSPSHMGSLSTSDFI